MAWPRALCSRAFLTASRTLRLSKQPADSLHSAPMTPFTRAFLVAGHLLIAASLAACDDPVPDKKPADSKSTTTTAKTAPSAAAEPPKPKGMPALLVDTMGPYLGSNRIDMTKADAAEK